MCDFIFTGEIHKQILARSTETLSKLTLIAFKYSGGEEWLTEQELLSPAVCFSV